MSGYLQFLPFAPKHFAPPHNGLLEQFIAKMHSLTEMWNLLLQFLSAGGAVPAALPVHRPGSLSNHSWVTDFSNLVTFGDSYTDESRLQYFQTHNGSAPPPGLLLPESNSTAGGGITWSRFVSTNTGAKLYDYAVNGAVCSNEIIFRLLTSIHMPFPDVVYEVDAFEADVTYVNTATGTNTLYTDRQPENTVYSMWIGTNDLGVNAFLTDSSLNMTTIPDYVDCIFDRFDDIYGSGGKYFVLMNTAPLQLSPLYGMPGEGGLATSSYWTDKASRPPSNTSEISGKMKEYTQLVNTIFDYRVPFELKIAKRYPGAKMAIFDINSLMTDMFNNPSQYFTAPANVTGTYTGCGKSSCPYSLDHFMWYDDLHPSQRSDEIIAIEFAKVVDGSSTYAVYW
ncbi:carbohydrate esterase family 16 protein [Coleophoma crateriformis]|uniref:Carbohydrate esterase family 16 protein n=1 Tax=Coleophoma crateriformis TaxID=565419 RepID=A0A3D8T022_9HELO|nr:carbohydrate esterase family 16 protein [Coleophoma crateriformis]